MKIKTKKQLNLSQLIEWLLKSGYRNYTANSNMGNTVTLSRYGAIQFSLGTFFPEETFTVEAEEEIKEDTPLSMIIECDEDSTFWAFENTTLKNIHQINCDIDTTKYYKDEDENMYIIWRDGKLVE